MQDNQRFRVFTPDYIHQNLNLRRPKSLISHSPHQHKRQDYAHDKSRGYSHAVVLGSRWCSRAWPQQLHRAKASYAWHPMLLYLFLSLPSACFACGRSSERFRNPSTLWLDPKWTQCSLGTPDPSVEDDVHFHIYLGTPIQKHGLRQ